MMKVSIFTCTHNPKYLKELYDSIKKQTHNDWERVVLLNNGARKPQRLKKSDKIRVHRSQAKTDKIGYFKNKACSYATGEILLEADHDDMLTPDCLSEVAKAFKDKEVGFVYSDNAKMGEFKPYNPKFGWTSYEYEGMPVMNSLPPIPANLGYIRFLPDHVRAWRKSVYDEIGGHNVEMEVCDDQELIMRTYLATKRAYINKPLYIYRITGDNVSIDHKNALIQQMTVQLYDQYIYKLTERRCELEGLQIMELDEHTTIMEHLDIKDGSVGMIIAHDALCKFGSPKRIMEEIHRILAPGGMLLSMTPSTDGRGAFQDPTHVSYWNENSFWYRIKDRPQHQYIDNDKVLFRESRLYTAFPTEWHRQNRIPYVYAHLSKE